MAVFKYDQQLYVGRGPLDAKSLIKTYAELLNVNTWTKEDTLIAYNGMIVAVWLNKDDTTKNGIYFLFDPLVTTALKKPDVTIEANWHKLAELSDTQAFEERLNSIDNSINSINEKVAELEAKGSSVKVYEQRSGFPSTGEVGFLYVAADEEKSYVWFNNSYFAIDDDDENEKPDIIHGGNASL